MFDISSKKGAFLFLVQSMLLAGGSRQRVDKLHLATFVLHTLADAIALDEPAIPDNVLAAAEEYVAWQDGWTKGEGAKETYPRPGWFNPPKRTDESGGYKYPWEK